MLYSGNLSFGFREATDRRVFHIYFLDEITNEIAEIVSGVKNVIFRELKLWVSKGNR